MDNLKFHLDGKVNPESGTSVAEGSLHAVRKKRHITLIFSVCVPHIGD